MNEKSLLLFICASVFSGSIRAESLVFESSDKAAKVSIDSAQKIGSDWGTQSFGEYLSISLSRKALPLLWVGVAYKDETGFSPEVIWGKSSKTALFLYRPQRGEVVLGVFRPDSATKFEPLLSAQDLEKFSSSMNNDPRDLIKRWTENWTETNDGVYEGDLIISATKIRKWHLQVATSKFPSVVSVLNQKDEN